MDKTTCFRELISTSEQQPAAAGGGDAEAERGGGGAEGGGRRVPDPGQQRALGRGVAGVGVRLRAAEAGEDDLAGPHSVGGAGGRRRGLGAAAAAGRARQGARRDGGVRWQRGQRQRRHRPVQGRLSDPIDRPAVRFHSLAASVHPHASCVGPVGHALFVCFVRAPETWNRGC